jgi:hypothetical protein
MGPDPLGRLHREGVAGCRKRPDGFPRCLGGSEWGVDALEQFAAADAAAAVALRRTGPPIPQSAFRIPQWQAPPCTWTFLSSLGKAEFFGRVLVEGANGLSTDEL